MRLYREGDSSVAICEGCHTKVATRMKYKDYTPPGWDVVVPEILVAVCENCGQVVGVPHQSTPRINGYRKTKPATDFTTTIEARVPREIDEALDLVTVSLGRPAKAIRPAVIRYYAVQMARKPDVAEAVKRQSGCIIRGLADRRIVVKLTHDQWARVSKAAKSVGIRSKSDLIRGIVLLAAMDFRIAPAGLETAPDPTSSHRRAFLRELAGTM